LDDLAPVELFRALDDDAWRWLNLDAREDCPFLRRYLPDVTGDPEFETVITSGGLDQAFQIHELVEALYEEHREPIGPETRVLDFGCGWGRVIRFFLNGVAPENLVGMDRYEGALAAARQTNRWCRFVACDTLPPTVLESDSFDLVYAFSVFSHLSEQAHMRWLEELARVLRPGGILIVTTFPRWVLERNAQGIAGRFDPVEAALADYDRGEFCYRAHHPGDPHYGDALIPEAYVRSNWTRYFAIRDYVRSTVVNQNVIVCSKVS